MMSDAVRKSRRADSGATPPVSPSVVKTPKPVVVLVTPDETLWDQIGQWLNAEWTPRHADSIEELLTESRKGQSGIILWDTRGATHPTETLSRLNLHSV